MDILSKVKQRIRRVVHIIYVIPRLIDVWKSRVVIVDTPVHGNLGDHAIAIAEQQLVQEIYGENSYCEVTAYDFMCFGKFLAKLTPMNRDILIHGGGSCKHGNFQ